MARSRGTPQCRCSVALPSLACASAVLWRAGPCSLESPRAASRQLLLARSLSTFGLQDDGQGYMRPAMLKEYLHTLDDEAAKVGAVRSAGDAAKSTAVLVGHPAALAACEAEQQQLRQQQLPTWDSPSVRRACRVLEPNAPLEVLGAVIGDVEVVHRQFDAHLDKLAILHDTIANLEDAAIELTLSRVCEGLSKVNHLLRVSGDILQTTLTDRHDALQRAMLSRVLGGDLPLSGVGLRSATEQALLAFIASRTETRPYVMHIFEGMRQAGISVDGCVAAFDAPVDAAIATLAARLDAAHMAIVWQRCATAAAAAEANFDALLAVQHDEPAVARGGGPLVEPGVEDAQLLQHRLAAVVDDFRVSELSRRLAAENCPEAWHDDRRTADLCGETTSHEWMWELNPRHLEQDSFVDAMRVRLGADRGLPAMQCHACGKLPGCRLHEHALCCAPGPSTSGHNEVRDIVLATAVVADPAVEPEAPGLLQAAPGLRPADILTYAARALDVGFASSDARHAGLDASDSMLLRKLAQDSRFVPELSEQGTEYQPLTWTCYGREHPATSAALTLLPRRAARRQGNRPWRHGLRLLRAGVEAALARRAAAVVAACFGAPAG